MDNVIARDDLKTLYHSLVDTRFAFVPRGEHDLYDVYALVKDHHPDLCDDSYLCSENCKSGHQTPEWQHRVRAAIDYLKRTSKGVCSGTKRRFWVFEQSTPTQLSQSSANNLKDPPKRFEIKTYRVLRDTVMARQIKDLHGHQCQICGMSIEFPDKSLYSEAHHIQPLGLPHEGPDVAGNIIVLCPNHHAMCDYGAIALDLEKLRLHAEHIIDPDFIDYHNEYIFVPEISE